jgi:hypothetical protein
VTAQVIEQMGDEGPVYDRDEGLWHGVGEGPQTSAAATDQDYRIHRAQAYTLGWREYREPFREGPGREDGIGRRRQGAVLPY